MMWHRSFLELVPVDHSIKGMLKNPSKIGDGLFHQRFRLHLLDEDTLCRTSHPGFDVLQPKDFVVKAAPLIKMSLTAIKCAATAGRVMGLPIPGLDSTTTNKSVTAIHHMATCLLPAARAVHVLHAHPVRWKQQ